MEIFTLENFTSLCDEVARRDPQLQDVINVYGYPPMWSRPPGFATLVHIILEQQVSLASALAAMEKLKSRIAVTPENLLLLTDDELRSCYFSRQKSGYARHLASMILKGTLDLDALAFSPDDEVIELLKRVKGIGNWSADIYLMMALHRADRFPIGDIALVKSFAEVKQCGVITRDEIAIRTLQWKPYRTIAAYLFWHAYLSIRAATKTRRH